MTRIVLRGLAWGHRRATGPLIPLTRSFARIRPDIELDWTVRPLSDFEHQGLHEIANIYDLIIYDHPFGGSIVETGAFLPLSDQSALRLQLSDADRYIGPSLLSYRIGGTVWGLPIDAATQCAVFRADLLDDAEVPRNWDEALALGRQLSGRGMHLGLAVESPHAILTIAALMANGGTPWETDPDQPFSIDRSAFLDAFDLVRGLLDFCPPQARSWNAIDLHQAMAERDDIVYCPCAFGYGTFGEPDQPRRLSFGPFAGRVAPFHSGSVLGGTALGISRATAHPEAALAFLAFAATQEAQTQLIPSCHGQPALASAWHDPDIDARFNGFFSATRASVEAAWIRPRHRKYIAFQAEAGRLVAAALTEKTAATDLWKRIEPTLASVNA